VGDVLIFREDVRRHAGGVVAGRPRQRKRFLRDDQGREGRAEGRDTKATAEKKAEEPPKPVEDSKAKITEKKEVQAAKEVASPPEPQPTKPDQIADKLKQPDEPKQQTKVEQPLPPKKPPQKPQPKFDADKIAALLDKRDPTRQAVTGDTLNSNAALGLAKGKAADNSATWGALFQSQVERCWKKPYGGIEAQKSEAAFAIKLKRDGTLEGMPVPEGTPATPYLRVYQESALRAIIECQPYNLPAAYFEEWKYFAPVFTERKT